MTDFIHEHPKDEPTPSPAPANAPPLDEKTGQKRVYGYIFLLFIVAFSLLLWSYMMNQRSNDEVLSELRGNADAMQTAIARNVTLEQRLDELQDTLHGLEDEIQRQDEQIKALTERNAALTAERDALQAQLEALTEQEESPAAPEDAT